MGWKLVPQRKQGRKTQILKRRGAQLARVHQFQGMNRAFGDKGHETEIIIKRNRKIGV